MESDSTPQIEGEEEVGTQSLTLLGLPLFIVQLVLGKVSGS